MEGCFLPSIYPRTNHPANEVVIERSKEILNQANRFLVKLIKMKEALLEVAGSLAALIFMFMALDSPAAYSNALALCMGFVVIYFLGHAVQIVFVAFRSGTGE